MRIKIIDAIEEDLKQTKKFRKIYTNIVPIWTDVKDFPAVAVVYDKDIVHRNSSTSSNRVIVDANVMIYVFNKQRSTSYDDNLSQLVDVVQSVIDNNKFLRCECIDALVTSFKRDGGIIMPFSIAQLTLSVKYLKTI